MLCYLRRVALKHSGDAILAYTTAESRTVIGGEKKSVLELLLGPPDVVTANKSKAYGIIVRWTKEGEKGLTKITETTPIMVIN